MGFVGPENKVIEELAVKQGPRSNIHTPDGSYRTSVDRVYAAGDCRRGQSLVVWGINEGRQAAREIDRDLRGSSTCTSAGAVCESGRLSAVSLSHLPVSGGVVPRTVSATPVAAAKNHGVVRSAIAQA
ncbi:hypothetical protein GGI04_006038 [Coemansia thaxteri]|nr:hypothetical protein GGI04_006038 [Coemansia thaxteri]